MTGRALMAIAAVLFSTAVWAESSATHPNAELAPEEVVRCQMQALGANDEQDNGIAIAFRFASPANKRVTGPLTRFIDMIKNSAYSVMLDYELIEYGEVDVRDDRASLPVRVLTSDFLAVEFRFFLSRQTHAECDGCWMTDAVNVVDVRRVPGLKT